MKKQTKSPSASKSPSKKAVAAKPAASKSPTKKAVAAAKAAVVKEDKRRREPPFLLYKEPSEPSFSEGIESVINLLKGKKRIAVLTGAGISVSCGIPDFRTKGSGLYSTLDTGELGLSCPEELFDYEFFQADPSPFYKFARNLYFPLGNNERVRPSDSHKLLALLEQKKMLLRVYSQNIDGLEEIAGVSPKKIVYAHGSLQWATCCKCNKKVNSKEMEADILKGEVALCQAPVAGKAQASRELSQRCRKRPLPLPSDDLICGGVLKPNVTFFGEALHDNVGKCLEADRDKVDALIVIGTSLSVAPISKVIGYLPPNIPRILINRTIVRPAHTVDPDSDDEEEKDFRDDYVFDAHLLGFCDDVTRALGKELFSASSETPFEAKEGKVVAALSDEDEQYDAEDWKSTGVPPERVFLFPGAQASSAKDASLDPSFQEVAHCDGCSKRIVGTIRKCVACFDYDLCTKCFPALSKTHYDGKHHFAAEAAAKKAIE